MKRGVSHYNKKFILESFAPAIINPFTGVEIMPRERLNLGQRSYMAYLAKAYERNRFESAYRPSNLKYYLLTRDE